MKKLLLGILNFRKKRLETYRKEYSDIALGQKPDALMVACCDSRVVPNVFASTNPGDLFVVRNIGNIVPPHDASEDNSVIAALDFSVLALNVKDIIVCGHSECGAMQAILNDQKPTNAIANWLRHGVESLKNLKSEKPNCDHNDLSKFNVKQQLKHLKTHPAVATRLAEGTLRLHGWWFELATGNVYELNDAGEFELMDEDYIMAVVGK